MEWYVLVLRFQGSGSYERISITAGNLFVNIKIPINKRGASYI